MTFAEKEWLSFFEGSEYPSIRLATLLFVWHEIVYWGRYIPYVICDHLPMMQKYKIQPV
jgi:methylsterol monooxygenase